MFAIFLEFALMVLLFMHYQQNPKTTSIAICFVCHLCCFYLNLFYICARYRKHANYLFYFGQKNFQKTPQVHNHHPIILGKVTHIQNISTIVKRVGRQAHHLVSSRELRSLQGLNDLLSQYYMGYQIATAVILSLWALHLQSFKMEVLV